MEGPTFQSANGVYWFWLMQSLMEIYWIYLSWAGLLLEISSIDAFFDTSCHVLAMGVLILVPKNNIEILIGSLLAIGDGKCSCCCNADLSTSALLHMSK
jgi:hypothetical protein